MNILMNWQTNHDASICFIKNGEIKYLKLERFYQIKHFGKKDAHFNTYWNFFIKNLDCEFKYFRSSNIEHHLKHALSVDLFESKPCDVHVVIDGEGDEKWYSVYRNSVLIESGNIFATGGSIGHGLAHSASQIGITNCDSLDRPGKLMGLQSYGKLNHQWYERLQKYNHAYIGEPETTTITSFIKNRNHLFVVPKDATYQEKLDIVHTIHCRAGEIILDIFQKYVKPNERVGYSGGVAQNVIWNTMLKKHYPNLIIYPHSSDEGISLGVLENFRQKNNLPKSVLQLKDYPFSQFDQAPVTAPSKDTIFQVAKHLSEGKIVAWYQGHGEVGPRALGNRSILLDPRIPNGKDIINRVKNREWYRPFGGSVLEEYAKDYFDLQCLNPYMLYLGNVITNDLPAISHVDGSCRIQTVAPSNHSFRTLLEMFYELTKCPVLLNTSLNQGGKPIAGWIKNAMDEFSSKPIDIMVIGDEILKK